MALGAAVYAASVTAADDRGGWIRDAKGCRIANPTPKPKETVDWSGPCTNGYGDGKGVLQFFVDGVAAARYEGELKRGIIDGRGVLRTPDGAVYDGDWVAGKPEGYGQYTAPDGSTYTGGWTAGKQDGPGTLRTKGGETLTGTWRAGQYVGTK
jgi:hypothetical protein